MDNFEICDNFKKTEGVESILIKDAEIDIQPIVSVCIPTYKRADSLKSTILSAVHQIGINDYNIIVVDNNPERNDETERLIQSLSVPRLKYYKNASNLGMFGNHNRAVELSDGKYTLFIHDDDMLFPDYLNLAVDILEKNEKIDFLFTESSRWDMRKDSEKPSCDNNRSRKIRKLTIDDFIYRNGYPPSGMIFVTKSMLGIGGYNDDYYPSSDYYFNVLAVLHSNVYLLKDKLFIYSLGINESLNPKTIMGWIEKDNILNEWMKSKFLICNVLNSYFKRQYSLNHFDKLVMNPNMNIDIDNLKTGLDLSPSRKWLDKIYYYVYYLYCLVSKRWIIG